MTKIHNSKRHHRRKSTRLLPLVRSWPKRNLRMVIVLIVLVIFSAVTYYATIGRAATTAKGDTNTSTVETRLLQDPNVLWVGTADSASSWKTPFGVAGEGQPQNAAVAPPPIPFNGKAVRLIHPGPNSSQSGDGRWGYDGRNTFANMGIAAQDEAYLRYYVWIPANLAKQGKMPGLQGTVGSIWAPAGGGSGTSPDGSTAWSARTMWKQVGTDPNKIGMITYLYVPYAAGKPKPETYSVSIRYTVNGSEQLFRKGAWNYVEQRVKMNTVGQKNGIFEGWINGVKGVSLGDVEYRTTNQLRINQWNLVTFWGGPPTDYPASRTEFFYDDFAISKSYIGARTDDDMPPIDGKPDLIVIDVNTLPANAATNQPTKFTFTIKNQGNSATPDGVVHGVAVRVNGVKAAWTDTSMASLAPGASRTLVTDGGPAGSDGSWTAPAAGEYSIEAWVDDVLRITETDEDNNTLTKSLTVTPQFTVKPGDNNGDGAVNGLDLSVILTNYGKSGQSRAQGDLTGDGTVNGLDLSQVLSYYGK